MKKTIVAVAFGVLFSCAAFAQDSTHNATARQNHKKTMHHNSTMPADSVNAGKITTNPNGKMSNRSSTMKRKTTKSTLNSPGRNSVDSTK